MFIDKLHRKELLLNSFQKQSEAIVSSILAMVSTPDNKSSRPVSAPVMSPVSPGEATPSPLLPTLPRSDHHDVSTPRGHRYSSRKAELQAQCLTTDSVKSHSAKSTPEIKVGDYHRALTLLIIGEKYLGIIYNLRFTRPEQPREEREVQLDRHWVSAVHLQHNSCITLYKWSDHILVFLLSLPGKYGPCGLSVLCLKCWLEMNCCLSVYANLPSVVLSRSCCTTLDYNFIYICKVNTDQRSGYFTLGCNYMKAVVLFFLKLILSMWVLFNVLDGGQERAEACPVFGHH